ncbi:MAG: hypothetical protein EOM12_15630 [Verrucomicrobiae bacterium]|nr:hypothetical protein [Verrucomicrobiae bacterium]
MRKHISLIMAALFVLWTAGSAFAVEDMGNCNLCKGTIGKVYTPVCGGQDNVYRAWFDYEASASTAALGSSGSWCNPTYDQYFTFDICKCDELLGGTLRGDTDYVLKAEIITPGVYFLGDNPTNPNLVALGFYNSQTILCDDVITDGAYSNSTNGTEGEFGVRLNLEYALYTNDGGSNVSTTAWRSSGIPALPTDLCEADFSRQSTFLMSDSFRLPSWAVLGSDGSYMLIDLPGYFMDPAVVQAGTQIQVKLYLAEANSVCPNCPPLCECVQTIAYVGCNPGGGELGIRFPYFVSLNEMAGGWWAGMAILNPGAGSVDVTITFKSGLKTAVLNKTLAGGSMEVGMVNNLIASATGGASFPTDGKIFVDVTPNGGAIDGFAMMGDGMQAQGYLPRLLSSLAD